MKDCGIVHIRTKEIERGPVAILGKCGGHFLGAWCHDFDSLALKVYCNDEITKEVVWSTISPQATRLRSKVEAVSPQTHKKVFQMLRKLEFTEHQAREKVIAALHFPHE